MVVAVVQQNAWVSGHSHKFQFLGSNPIGAHANGGGCSFLKENLIALP